MNRKLITAIVLLAFVTLACACLFPERITPTPQTSTSEKPLSPALTPTPEERTQQLPLEVELVDAPDLERFPSSSDLVLHFNQPMQPLTGQPALLSYPMTETEERWDDSFTQLSVDAQRGFEPGQTIHLFINPSLETATGQSFAAPPQWKITTLPAPHVSGHQPAQSQLDTRNPSIKVTFDRPMDDEATAKSFTVQPEFEFTLQWADDRTLELTPQQPLEPGTRYHFTVSGQATDKDGGLLWDDYNFDLWLNAWTVEAVFPGPLDNDTLQLNFSYAVNRASVEEALRFDPPLKGKQLWTGDKTLNIQTDQPLPRSQIYTLTFAGDVLDQKGDPLPTLEPLRFITPPSILSYGPQEIYFLDAEKWIEITFDRPMEHALTEAAFHLEPSVIGAFSWDGNTMHFSPGETIQPYIQYTAILEPTATDAEGNQILLEPFRWTFTTDYLSYRGMLGVSFGDYGPNAQVLDVDGRRAVQFVANSQAKEVSFELYRMSLKLFLDRYSSRFKGVAGREHLPIDLDGTTLEASWTKSIAQPGYGYEKSIYETIIPEGVSPGFYILNLTDGEENDQLILILTANTIIVKQAEGQIVAWVSDIGGGPVPRAEVSIYARDGTLIERGQAGEDGVFQTQIPRDPQPLIVIARRGNDYTASGLSDEWRSSRGYWQEWWRPAPTAPDYAVYIYTDRPIYRPGQSVFFKAIVRSDDDAALDILPEGTSVTLRIRDARDNVVQTYELQADAFGAVNGEFILAEGAMLGNYHIEVAMPVEAAVSPTQPVVEKHRQLFKVQDYRKPDYQVNITSDATQYVVNDSMQFTLQANYYFGEPVAGASLSIRQYYLYTNWAYEYGYDEDAEPYIWYQSNGYEENATTDAAGRYTFSLPARLGEYYDYSVHYSSDYHTIWGIEVTVDDGSHQTVSNFAVVKVYAAAETIEVDAGDFLKRPGEAFTLRLSVDDLQGKPVEGRALTVELRRWSRRSYNYDVIVKAAQASTDANGRASLDFTIDQAGYYLLQVKGQDSFGNEMSRADWLYAYARDLPWYSDFDQDLRITADQESYEPGETALLTVESSFAAQALLTFERGKTHREMVFELKTPITLVYVPIEESDAPNIYVTVNAYKPQDTQLTEETYQSWSDANLRTAGVELSVPVTEKKLIVSITPDRDAYLPRQEATFNIKVTNEVGNPVQAQLSLALVDEAIFSLSDELSGPIFEAFYGPRDLVVRTYDAMALTRELVLLGRGGGGGGDQGGTPRSLFPDTAAWLPDLVTDANGELTISLALPDNLTSWRLTARAVTQDTQVGEAYINVVTRQEVVIRPILPRQVTVGDQVTLSAMVHNYSDQPLDLLVSLSPTEDLTNLLEIEEPITQTISISPGEVHILGWQAVARATGEVKMLARAIPASGDGPRDAVVLILPVQMLAVPDVVNQSGVFGGQSEPAEYITSLYLPEGALPSSKVQVEVSRSPAGSLLTGLEYLTGYPYGCVEQTMSRALPNAVVGRAFSQLGVPNPTMEADLPPMIRAGLQRLYGYQHDDGGWGWWFDDQTHDYQTAWVVFGLSITSQAGYEVDSNVILRGVNWLKTHLDEMDIRTRAYALYSMAVAGYGDLNATRALADEALFQLDTFSQAALALTLEELGDSQQARQVLGELAETATRQDGHVFWPQPNEDGHYYDKTMASSTRSTALALAAFTRIDPEHEFIPGIVQYLIDIRRPYGWGSTNETAFTILALTDHLLSLRQSTEGVAYDIELNGQSIASGALSPAEPAFTAEIYATQLQPGFNVLRLRQSGSGRLYYAITSRMLLSQDAISSAGSVEVRREYLDPITNVPLESIQAGQLVKVSLTVTLPRDGFYVIVEDHLPGGFEALNESLNTTSHEQINEWEEPHYFWETYGYNQKEVHFDKVSFFITEFGTGQQVITYLARVTHAGSFTALPVEVSAMYDETLWGRSESTVLTVRFYP